jgi:hypothetical protein
MPDAVLMKYKNGKFTQTKIPHKSMTNILKKIKSNK